MRRTIAILTAAGLTMIPLAAHALDERVWIALNGGGSTYGMSELNSELDAYNASYSGTFKHIEKGRSLGFAVGFETASHWNYGLGFDRLDASTSTTDPMGEVHYRLGANAWRAFGEYSFAPIGHTSLLIGGAFGVVQEHGKFVLITPGYPPEEFKTIGNGPLFEAHAGGNVWVTNQIALTATAGYRYARVKELKLEGGFPIVDQNGNPLPLDFSGPTARVGIKFAAKSVMTP
jgi:opacity protein-like surface antigen